MKIISHALLSPLLTSTCFHRQMLISRDNVHACSWQLSSVDLLRAITCHQTAQEIECYERTPIHLIWVTVPRIAWVWDFERLMTVTKPGVAHIYCRKRFYRISRPWSDLTVTRSHKTVFFIAFFLSFTFYFSLIVPPLSLPHSSALPRTR